MGFVSERVPEPVVQLRLRRVDALDERAHVGVGALHVGHVGEVKAVGAVVRRTTQGTAGHAQELGLTGFGEICEY